MKSNVTTKHYS